MLAFAGWCIRWAAAALIFLVVVAVSGYYVYTAALEAGDTITVPNIVDLPITEASSLLAEAGLEMGKQVQVPHEVVPKYHVISQRPAPGQVVRTGRRVTPTVSLGADSEVAPDLLRRSREEAEREIKTARFHLGAVSRIPDSTPRDTVLAQDPPPGSNVPRETSISLLLSAGSQRSGAFMPDIQERSVLEIRSVLAPFRVYLAPRQVDIPNAPVDVVLSQDPAPNTLIQPGQVVTYEVKPSGSLTLPSDQHQAEVRHPMNEDFYDKTVRIVVVDRQGNREVKQTYEPDYSEQARQTRVAGSTLRIVVSYIGNSTLEVYVDNRLVQSYHLKDGAAPAPRDQ